jgi:hypothetical protein
MGAIDILLWVLVIIVALICGAVMLVSSNQRRRYHHPQAEPFGSIKNGALVYGSSDRTAEGFAPLGSIAGISLQQVTTRALDAAPSVGETKDFYKTLLVFADADIRRQGTDGLRILADFRDRLFDRPDFRDNLTYEDFLANWPAWLPPLDPTQKEPVPSVEEAVTAEARLLAFLQRNYPAVTSGVADDQTNDVVLALVRDFGFRFVFKEGEEQVQLKSDFMTKPLLTGWANPTRTG